MGVSDTGQKGRAAASRAGRASGEKGEKGQTTITIDMLREHMKTNETFDRIIDVFAKLDTDGSGQVDHKEFETGVMGTIANCDPADVFELFCEVDQDGSGQISYLELKESFRAAD